MTVRKPHLLGAGTALRRIDDGELSCVELMNAYIGEIKRREPKIKAWIHLNEERALGAARQADEVPKELRGPLHGLPIGVKDTFDTEDFLSECGVAAWKGREPGRDAVAVKLMRRSGAIVMGKTVTTEYALLHPSPTRNPHNLRHTPGGSSSGSAAAVAAHMTALALGSQTNASVIRPASYCGVYGFKASFGLIPRTGVAPIASTLDTVGLFARDLLVLARALEVLVAPDIDDPLNQGLTLTGLEHSLTEESKRPWRVGFIRSPVWDQVKSYAQVLIENVSAKLAAHVDLIDLDLPPSFRHAHEEHMVIQDHGVASHLNSTYLSEPKSLSAEVVKMIRRGNDLSPSRIEEALNWQQQMIAEMDTTLGRVDVAITAAATGEAPGTLKKTGDPIMSTIWTFTGTPALSVPYFLGPRGLPVGLQVVAQRNRDADVLAFAAFLESLEV